MFVRRHILSPTLQVAGLSLIEDLGFSRCKDLGFRVCRGSNMTFSTFFYVADDTNMRASARRAFMIVFQRFRAHVCLTNPPPFTAKPAKA